MVFVFLCLTQHNTLRVHPCCHRHKPFYFLFYFSNFWLHCVACGILVSWPGIKSVLPALEGRVLTSELAGKPQHFYFWLWSSFVSINENLVFMLIFNSFKVSWILGEVKGRAQIFYLTAWVDCGAIKQGREEVIKTWFGVERDNNL